MPDLEPLVLLADEIAAGRPRSSLPLLVWCPGAGAGPSLETRSLDGAHPAAVLLGVSAPASVSAVGVVATGHDDARRPVRVTVLVGVDGRVAGRLVTEGGAVRAEAPVSGVLLDVLLRTVGCATAPPEVPLVELLASAWLSQLAAGDRRVAWPEVARVHLALQLLAHRGADELVPAGIELAEELGWSGMRRVVAGAGWPGVCTPTAAAWLDDGAFARWTLGCFPPVGDLLAGAVAGRPPGVADAIRRAAHEWGLG